MSSEIVAAPLVLPKQRGAYYDDTHPDAEVGYIWINESSEHFLGAPFGGTK